jgi:hypothetical protein
MTPLALRADAVPRGQGREATPAEQAANRPPTFRAKLGSTETGA